MISVVIPLYNKENSILSTINSVLLQTYSHFELIVVNDGSTDRSLEIVKSIKDERIVIVDLPNEGVSSARNAGVMRARNEYIAFLDGDDIWHFSHLDILFSSLVQFDNSELGGVASTFYKSYSRNFDNSKTKECVPRLIKDYFDFMGSPIPRFNSSTLLIKKSKAIDVGLFDQGLKYGEDVEFWYRIFSKYKLLYVDTVTVIYFLAAENRSVSKIIPLKDRFHKFEYRNSTLSERRYLDKLVALILLDYIDQRAFKVALSIFLKYWFRMFGVFRYFFLLLKRRII